ncbi:MAG: flavodoxin family protein [Bdellovibrionia bacterium]
MKKQILIINGSPQSKSGNCAYLIQQIQNKYKAYQFEVLHLKSTNSSTAQIFKKIQNNHAVLFVSGTYWDSWGSPLQKFLEDFTPFEGHPSLVGKPAGVITLMHSVGGKSVLSRLQGVLNTLGFLIPPMGGMTYALSNQLITRGKRAHTQHADDFWSLDDIDVILSNLVLTSEQHDQWKAWPVDRKNFKKVWLK